MTNGQTCKNLNEAIYSEEVYPIFESEMDRLVIIESYDELIENLKYCYCAMFRTREQFKKNLKFIYVSPDADIEIIDKIVGKNKGFVGKWDRYGWQFVKKELLKLCERKFIVKEEWLKMLEDQILVEGRI